MFNSLFRRSSSQANDCCFTMARLFTSLRQKKPVTTTTTKRRQTPLAWIVSISVGSLVIIVLLVEVLFFIVSMKASHQMLMTMNTSTATSIRSVLNTKSNLQTTRNETSSSSSSRGNRRRNGDEMIEPTTIHKQQQLLVSDQVIEMCSRTLWHTVETTTIVLPNHETFIHTGDIDDLWLRDSAAQVVADCTSCIIISIIIINTTRQ